MTRGEKCLLTCSATYAYGERGSPPKIPGGATLQFEVELLDWESKSDLTKDGGVIKTVIAEVTSWEEPKERDEVFIKYKVWREGFPEEILSSSDNTSFTLSSPPPSVPKGVITLLNMQCI
jgi:FK506-binding protein 4/5